eukprot:TRINITY_DN2239_c0_g1_i4.p2 TRINITY_DN2239_c0_g1~~TRINITY_DN2239_c0_g1_i4.p2  ORF type:complete len:138 (+),score=30.13 TRINITY_DN2239_c0_g1_i4:255-668(+)
MPGMPVIQGLLLWFDKTGLANLLADPVYIDNSYICDTISGSSQRRYTLLSPAGFEERESAKARSNSSHPTAKAAAEEAAAAEAAAEAVNTRKAAESRVREEAEKAKLLEAQQQAEREAAEGANPTRAINLICQNNTR